MLRLGPESGATCFVFTYKEGLLSAVAHDLKLSVTAFSIELADDLSRVEATLDARSLRVVCTMHDGHPGAPPGDRDRASIEKNVVDDVLAARKFPDIRFASSVVRRDAERATVEGALTLHGKTRNLTVQAVVVDGEWVARVRLQQPDFGIRPYSAMLGTLRVRAEVDVEVRLPVYHTQP